MTDLDHVLERFPKRANEIRRLYLGNTAFRSICEDLVLAYKSLNGPFADGTTGGSDVGLELQALRDELEAELLEYLNQRTVNWQ